MKITVAGAGAMGTLFAGLLSRGNEVSIIEKDPVVRAAIARHGIRLTGITDMTVPPSVVKISSGAGGLAAADLVLICVKSYDTVSVLKKIHRYIGCRTTVMTLQNGIGNYENILKSVGKNRAVCGTTSQAATIERCGEVRHTGCGDTFLGRSAGAEVIAKNFSGCGINTRTVKNIQSVIWSKLVLNCAINPVGGIAGVTNGEILEYANLREVASAAGLEAACVARVSGIKLLFGDVVGKVSGVCGNTSGNTNSMLADIKAGRETEIDFINGAVVKKAGELCMIAPVNKALCEIVKKIAPHIRFDSGRKKSCSSK